MKKDGKFFFGYSILLFSVAFVLILFSSFSGLRYQEAQDEKNQQYQGAQKSVVKLTEKNEQLENDNKIQVDEITKLKEENKKLQKDIETEKKTKETVIKNMDALASAQNFYSVRSYNSAREKISQIDRTALSENAKIQYDNLKKKLY